MAGAATLFYRIEPDMGEVEQTLAALRERQDARVRWWRPSWRAPFAPGRLNPLLWSYTILDVAGAFATRNYGAVMLEGMAGHLDHVSMIFPRFARFPFMAKDDLQIGATYTRLEARGRRLALRAVLEVLARFGRPGRAFWYLVDEDNIASIAVIERAGFTLVGRGGKRPRAGLRFLGYYEMAAPRPGGDARPSNRSN